jgi:hypothetical protein
VGSLRLDHHEVHFVIEQADGKRHRIGVGDILAGDRKSVV